MGVLWLRQTRLFLAGREEKILGGPDHPIGMNFRATALKTYFFSSLFASEAGK